MQEKFNDEFKVLMEKCVSNYGKWSLTTLPSGKKGLDPIDMQYFYLNPL